MFFDVLPRVENGGPCTMRLIFEALGRMWSGMKNHGRSCEKEDVSVSTVGSDVIYINGEEAGWMPGPF